MNGILMTIFGENAILVAMSTESVEKLGEGVEVATANIREVLRKESGWGSSAVLHQPSPHRTW